MTHFITGYAVSGPLTPNSDDVQSASGPKRKAAGRAETAVHITVRGPRIRIGLSVPVMELNALRQVYYPDLVVMQEKETVMGFGRGALLWILGVPIPIIILLALFWHH